MSISILKFVIKLDMPQYDSTFAEKTKSSDFFTFVGCVISSERGCPFTVGEDMLRGLQDGSPSKEVNHKKTY